MEEIQNGDNLKSLKKSEAGNIQDPKWRKFERLQRYQNACWGVSSSSIIKVGMNVKFIRLVFNLQIQKFSNCKFQIHKKQIHSISSQNIPGDEHTKVLYITYMEA